MPESKGAGLGMSWRLWGGLTAPPLPHKLDMTISDLSASSNGSAVSIVASSPTMHVSPRKPSSRGGAAAATASSGQVRARAQCGHVGDIGMEKPRDFLIVGRRVERAHAIFPRHCRNRVGQRDRIAADVDAIGRDRSLRA